jgi:hypothetical protein
MANQYKVVLKAIGGNKINVIKAVREITPGLGLQEAKALVESLGTVAEGLSAEEAAKYRAKLETVGATVEIVAMAEVGVGPAKPARDLEIGDLTGQIAGLSADVIARLETEKGIKTLADIRRNGGLPEVQGLTPEIRSNLEAHAYLSLVSLYFARKPGITNELQATLQYKSEGGSVSLGFEATSVDGMISIRRGNTGPWTAMLMNGNSPVGDWEPALPREVSTHFKNEEIKDILFVITCGGRTPEWLA